MREGVCAKELEEESDYLVLKHIQFQFVFNFFFQLSLASRSSLFWKMKNQ